MPAAKKTDPVLTEDRPAQTIEEIKRQWMATVDAMEDGVVWVDKDYRIHKFNKSFTSEHQTGDYSQLVGQACYKVFANRTSPCNNCGMKNALQENKTARFEIVRHSQGKEQSFEVTAQPIHDENANSEGMIVVYRDQTEAKTLRQQLLQSEKLNSIGNLAGGVAHELNNPLAGILAFAQVLQRELPKESQFAKDVEEIIHAARRCRNIVKDLLFFARNHQPSRSTTKNIPTNLSSALNRALRLVHIGMQQEFAKIKVEYKEPPSDLTVKGNEDQLIQIFINLLTNAAQAIDTKKRSGRLEIYLEENLENSLEGNSSATVVIRDNGHGITAANLPRIFEPFFTTKDVGQGTGLGLSVTYGIVKDLGGDIKITSTEGQGTTCFITLPALSR